MANGHLGHPRHVRQKGGQVVAVQVMAGVDTEARRQCRLGGRAVARQFNGRVRSAPGLRIGLGVELDAISPQRARLRHGRRLGIHEQADAYAERLRLANQRPQALAVAGQIPAVVGGESRLGVGHKRGLIGPHRAHEVHQLVQRIALDVELAGRPLGEQLGELGHIVWPDVPAVRPRMHGDTVGTGLQRNRGKAGHARNTQAARVAQVGNLVQVDAQGCHRRGLAEISNRFPAQPADALLQLERRSFQAPQILEDATRVQRLAAQMVANQRPQQDLAVGCCLHRGRVAGSQRQH